MASGNYLEEYTATDDEFFLDYQPTTNDPGRWLTNLTVSCVAAAALLLGPAVVLGRKLKKQFKARKAQRAASKQPAADAYLSKNDEDDDTDDTNDASPDTSAAEDEGFEIEIDNEWFDGVDDSFTVPVQVDECGGRELVEFPKTSALRGPLFSKTFNRMSRVNPAKFRRDGNASGSWEPVTDASTGGVYWYNRNTGEVTWNEPPKKLQYSPPSGAKKLSSWTPIFEPGSGKFFWCDSRTGETSWNRPPELVTPGHDEIGRTTDVIGACGPMLGEGFASTASDSESDDDSDDEDGNFEDYDFKELPPHALEAAKVLGYNRKLWDKSIPPPTEELDWDELTEEQQRAAKVLGYDESKWDGDDSDDSDDESKDERKRRSKNKKVPKVSESYDDDGLYDDYEWNELPSEVKKAAKTLGYDRRLWDFGTHSTTGSSTSASEDKSWKALTEEERAAAKVMGYTAALWNHTPSNLSRKEEIVRGWETFLRVISFDRECKQILWLALPFTAESIIDSVLDAVVSAFISSYLGPTVFTAYAMVSVFFSLTDSFSDAIDEASEILMAQALGVGNFFLAGQYVQLSLVAWLIIDVPVFIVWIFSIDKAILALGLGAEIAAYAKAYVPITALAGVIEGIVSCANGLLACDGKAHAVFLIDSSFHVMHTVAVGVAVTKFNFGLAGIAWIEVVAAAAYGLFLIIFLSFKGWLNPYKKGIFRNFSVKNWPLVKAVLKLGLPLSFGYFLANGEWEVLTFFAAAMGPAEVAAWSIAGAIWDVMEEAPSGLSSAAVIRIGIHLGKGHPTMAKISSYKAILYSCIWAAALTGLFVAFSGSIINLFTADPVLVDMLESLVVLIAAGNVLMVLGSDAWHIVSAQSRGKVATATLFTGMWCITLPLSVYFVFVQNYNLQALGAAVMIGYTSIAFLLLYFVFTSNWAKISMKAISKANRSTGNKVICSTPLKKKKNVANAGQSAADQYSIMIDDSSDMIPPNGVLV